MEYLFNTLPFLDLVSFIVGAVLAFLCLRKQRNKFYIPILIYFILAIFQHTVMPSINRHFPPPEPKLTETELVAMKNREEEISEIYKKYSIELPEITATATLTLEIGHYLIVLAMLLAYKQPVNERN
jgi:hypothetical protein